MRCRTNFALPPFCVESCCCAFYGDVTENSRRFCFRLILHAPQCKEYRAKPRFETANGIWKSPFLKQVRCRTNFAFPPFCVESCCCAFYSDGTENSRRFCFRLILHSPQCKGHRAKPRFETANGIEKSVFLKQVRCRTNFKLRLFSVQKVVLFPKYALNFASIFFKLSLSGNFLVVKPLF